MERRVAFLNTIFCTLKIIIKDTVRRCYKGSALDACNSIFVLFVPRIASARSLESPSRVGGLVEETTPEFGFLLESHPRNIVVQMY